MTPNHSTAMDLDPIVRDRNVLTRTALVAALALAVVMPSQKADAAIPEEDQVTRGVVFTSSGTLTCPDIEGLIRADQQRTLIA